MNGQPTLPSWAVKHLPMADSDSVFTWTEERAVLVAGTHALFLIDETGLREGGMWYQVQYARWDANTRKLVVVWVDPDRPLLTLTTTADNPARFMKILTSRVDKAIVVSRQVTVPSGARLTATIRRRIDGELFSSVTVQGELASRETEILRGLEAEVRREVGLSE